MTSITWSTYFSHSSVLPASTITRTTEPVVRVMVEAGTHEECEKYVDDVIAVIKEKGYAVE